MDWHGKQTIYVVLQHALFDKLSVGDAGTLAQLKASCCPSVPDNPYGKMNDWEPFMRATTLAHLVAAARQYFGMPEHVPAEKEYTSGQQGTDGGEQKETVAPLATAEDTPTQNWDPPGPESPASERRAWFLAKLGEFVDYHVPAKPFPPDIPAPDPETKKKKKRSGKSVHGKVHRQKSNAAEPNPLIPGVFNYASQVLWFGLFLATWDDSVGEGDVDRVVRNWTVILPLFHA
jgi:hypothetical protein